MKISVLAIMTSVFFAGAALAQDASPPASPSAAPAASETAPAGKPKPKEVLAGCRDEAKSQGLKGDERKKAVEECFLKQRPDLAGWEKCRTDPEMKGKDKDERKAAMKECIKNSKN